MSSILDGASATQETALQAEKGVDSFLSSEERAQVQRFLNFPEEFPKVFKSWLLDFIAVNGLAIPISQISGFSQFTARSSEVFATESVTGASYGNIASVGPTLSGLSDGQWIFWYGLYSDSDADVQVAASLSFNGVTATDADGIRGGVDGLVGDQTRISIMRGVFKILTNGGSNEVQMKYKKIAGASNPTVGTRWLIGLKTGN